MFGSGETRLQPAYVEDVAEAIVRVLWAPAVRQLYELAGPRVYTYQELLRTIAASVGTRPFLVRFPFSLWHVIGFLPRQAPVRFGLGAARRQTPRGSIAASPRSGGLLRLFPPRRAMAAPRGRLACSRGSRRRGRAGAGRVGAATSRADREAPPRDAQPPLNSARPPACEINAGRRLRRRRRPAPIRRH
jgi:hypothetical protein